jgi:hypothetical protein
MRPMIEIRSNDVETACAVCGRTMLLGERLLTYDRRAVAVEGDGVARVCELCTDEAQARGWLREGAPPPLEPPPGPPRRGLRGLFRRRQAGPLPLYPEDVPTDPRDALDGGIELFNESSHPRTLSRISRTLGDPQVSVVPRSQREMVVTVAWDLYWYQYRVDVLGPQPVMLQRRGEDPAQIADRFRQWNALTEPDGRVAMAS